MIGTLRPGESVEIGPTTRRVSLNTFMSGESMDFAESPAANAGKDGPYDRSSRDMAYVLQAMMFYDAAGGRKRTGMANDYQGFTDLSGLLKAGRAVLVAMPPQDGSCRGGDLLRGPCPSPANPTIASPWAMPWTATRPSTASSCPLPRPADPGRTSPDNLTT